MSYSANSRISARREPWLVALAAAALSLASLAWCWSHHLLLLYGDAVAHLHIARRIFDTRTPGLTQLGSVWLPLPHLLLLPFVAVNAWWRTGLAGAFVSMPAYVFAVVALFRIARVRLSREWSAFAAAAFALNPGLLYMQTTAMTEPLFLALVLWATLWMIQTVQALDRGEKTRAARTLLLAGFALTGAVLTRYDGWIFAAIAGLSMLVIAGPRLWRSPAGVRIAAACFALLLIAAPLWWFWYNAHYFHDWLDFVRGPYSARAIEERTRPAGGARYPGYHHLWWAWLYYGRVATLGAGAWRLGQAFMVLSVAGSAVLAVTKRCAATWLALLLWFPLPFYMYSVAYGSVPIFFPLWPPYSYYNTRYGMELLPVFALFSAIALAWIAAELRAQGVVLAAGGAFILVNFAVTVWSTPLVLQEAYANSRTRIPFETQIADDLGKVPPGATVMIFSSAHAGALQRWGRPLRETVNESDWYLWPGALQSPATAAAYVLAVDGDPVAMAVAAHPQQLTPIATVTELGQPRAVLYRSENPRWLR